MTTRILPAFILASIVAFGPALLAQTSDFPGASDFPNLKRPAGTTIIGAHRIDNDEFSVPVGPVGSNSKLTGKSVSATGSIDTLAYAGATTTSSLSSYSAWTGQLREAGYTEVWGCARATYGNAYTLINYLAQPTIDTMRTGNWGRYMIEDLYATNDDTRYGVFRKGGEFMLVATSLAPGKPSGSILIRISNPPAVSILQ